MGCLGKQFFCSLSKKPLLSLKQSSTSLPPNPTDLTMLRSNGYLNQALLEMAEQGFNMKFKGYNALLDECVRKGALREGQRVQSHMIKTRYHPCMYLRTRLIGLYLKSECLSEARRVFDEMPKRTVVPWTAMISGYAQRGYATEALDLFLHMLRSGVAPNEFTLTAVLTSCIGAFGFYHGRQIHCLIVKRLFESDKFIGSSLIDMYAKAGRMLEAQDVFKSLPERDVVLCTAIISGFAQKGLDKEALELFRKLQIERLNFNYVTYASILTALSGLSALELGKQVHGHILRLELPFYLVLQNSLIDMYSKCGNLTYSRRVFDNISERSTVSWNAMLAAYGKHGMGKEVIEVFNLMKKDNRVKPDSITILTVLSGCSHGGIEQIGLEIFGELLQEKDGVGLGIEHYGCVVDLLGRSGQLERALHFIKQMPLQPNAALWGSLLGACKFHQNAAIGEIAGNQLFELEPENVGNYVDLSHIYASTGSWEKLTRLRVLMKRRGMVKGPGKSWIEVD